MEAERWRKVEQLYRDALDLQEPERGAFLNQACSSDADLLQQVRALLASDAAADDFLETPALEAAARMLAADGDALPGQVARYHIIEKLGAGGMSVVYKAEEVPLGRLVALKFLPEAMSHDRATRERFQREARLASALDHPHICTIYEIGSDGGRFFIAMQYLEGETVKQRVKRKAFSVDELLEYAVQIADALDAAHAAGIVHRDIKPANIIITRPSTAAAAGERRGLVKVLDFGIARRIGDEGADGGLAGRDPNPALSGMTPGTAAYMSPEQTRGEAVDARSDLFSFGVVLYEMATGRQAFSGITPASIRDAILNQEPLPPSKINRALPAGFDSLISRALEKDRELRYQGAADLRAELKRLRRDAAGDAATRESGPGAGKLRKLWWSSAAAIVLALVSLAVFRYVPVPARMQPRPFAERKLTASFGAPVRDAAISPDGSLLAYADSNNLYLKLLDTGETHPLPLPPGARVYQIAWHPNNRRLLLSAMPSAGLKTQLWTISVFGGAPVLLRDDVRDVAVSPDGKSIVFTTNSLDSIWVASTAGEPARKVLTAAAGTTLSDPQWRPGTNTVVYVATSRTPLQLWYNSLLSFQSLDVQTGQPGLFHSAAGFVGDFAILRDGRMLFLQGIGNNLKLVELRPDQKDARAVDHGQTLQQWDGVSQYRLTASADGTRVTVLRRISELGVYVARLENGGKRLEEIRRLRIGGMDNSFHAWTPDGRAVVFESNRNGAYRIFSQALDSPDRDILLVDRPGAAYGRYSPDGKWLFYRQDPPDGGRRLMRVAAGGGLPQIVLNDSRIRNYYCAGRPTNFCIVSLANRNQMVFAEFDPAANPPANGFPSSQLREVAASDYGPTDWGISPDGSSIAMVRPDPDEARIHLIPVRGHSGSMMAGNAPLKSDVVVRGWTGFYTVNWAPDGKGWYASTRVTSNGAVRVPVTFAYVDAAGNATALNAPESFISSWGVASPNGKYLAFPASPAIVDVWLLER